MSNSGSKKTKLIDIVTPTLNVGKYIENCLLSTKHLRCLANHIVVDGGSTDATLEIVCSAAVRSIHHPPGNMYSAINRGISETNSEWVTYLNGDDIIYPDTICKALESVPDNCDVIYGNIDYIDTEGRFLHYWRSAKPANFAGLFASVIMPLPQQGALFRRSLWERLGGFDERFKYAADFDFFLRAFREEGRFFYYKNFPIAAFRLHGDQISQNHLEKMLIEGRESIEDSSLVVGHWEKISAVSRMRARNIDSYIVRLLRNFHINQTKCLVKSI